MARRFTNFDDIGDLETDYLYGSLGWQASSISSLLPLEPLTEPFFGLEIADSHIVFGLPERGVSTEDPLIKQNIPQFFLNTLDGTNGFFLNGEGAGDQSGNSVSGIGDINGDGVSDFIVGAFRADFNGSDSGASYVVFGTNGGFPTNFELGSVDGTNGFRIIGGNSTDQLGVSVSGIGDVNSDGIDDIIMGSNGDDESGFNAGAAFVIYGATSFAAEIDVAVDIDGFTGSRINGVNSNDQAGSSVSGIGDFNGDGIDDILIGALFADPNGNESGQSYVVFGQGGGLGSDFDLSTLDGFNGFAINGVFGDALLGGDNSGHSVSGIGDINGDGLDDIIIGAPNTDPGSLAEAGQAYVIFGTGTSFTSGFELSSLLIGNGGDGSLGFAINGISAGDQLGSAVANVGDVNNDGIDDFAVLASSATGGGSSGAGAGEVYIIYGNNGGFAAEIDVTNLTSPQGFTINGRSDGDALSSVSAAGDFNGDGIADILIGSETGQIGNAGEAYIVFGISGNHSVDVNLGSGGGVTSMLIEGISPNDGAGSSVSAVGDVNGDGIDDILIGAPNADTNSNANSGQSYIIFGGPQFGPNQPTARDDTINASTANDVFDLRADNGNGADSDPNGDFLTITAINGTAVLEGDSITLSSGIVVTVVADFITGGLFVQFTHNGLALGETISDTFNYTIDDGTGGTSTANVAVNFLQNGILPDNLDGTNGFTVVGAADSDTAGDAVAMIGDVNGDGIDDFIVASGNIDTNGNENSGAAAVFFGSALTPPSTLSVADLDGTNGFRLNGVAAFDRLGDAVSGLGDVNGDGIDDFIIGSENANSFRGQAYVVFGSAGTPAASVDLADLLIANGGDGSLGFVINGAVDFDSIAAAVSGAGDFNGDGFADIIVGGQRASAEPNNEGQSYVIFGSDLGFPAEIDVSLLNGTNGFILHGVDAFDSSGNAVTGIGDINGDGLDDLLVGASSAEGVTGTSTGESYVVFGTSSILANGIFFGAMPSTEGFTISGISDFDFSGTSVSGGGDINGDGIDDFIIGANGVNSNDLTNVGATYVVFGSTGGFGTNLDLSTLDGSNGFVINGIRNLENSGASVANAGDFNGDGFDDIVIGAPGAGEQGLHGAYVLFGSASGFSGAFDLSDLNGTNGVFLGAGDGFFAGTGSTVDGAGDVNNDGFDDIIVGSPGSGATGAGETYIVFGFGTNTPPVAANDEFSTDEDTPTTGNVFDDNNFGIDEDADGDTFTVTEVDGSISSVGTPVLGSNGGQFIINTDGSFNFDPNGDFEFLPEGDQDTTTITYTIDDGFGGTDEATVAVTVTGVNDAPIAEDDFFEVDENDALTGNVFDINALGSGGVADSDPDTSDILTVIDVIGEGSISGGIGVPVPAEEGGLVTVNGDGSFTFNQNGDFDSLAVGETAETSVTYIISDGNGGTSTADIIVTVNGVNDNPIANDDNFDVDLGDALSGSLFADNGNGVDVDEDGDVFTITDVEGSAVVGGAPIFVAGNSGGTFTVNADGTFSFDDNGDFDNLDLGASLGTSIAYTIDDGNGGVSTAVATVVVTQASAPNTPPIAADDDFAALENSNISGNVFDDNGNGADSDDDGDTLTVITVGGDPAGVGQFVQGSDGGQFIIGADGAFSFDANEDFNNLAEGETVVTTTTYTIDDGNGGTSTATISVTVTGTPPPSFNLADLVGSNGFAMTILNADDEAGFSVANAGDVNGDGIDDLLVGSHFADPGGTADAGQTYVVFGGSAVFDAALDLTALDGTDGFSITGIKPFDNSGWSVASAGDVNGDGIDDIMVGAQLADSETNGQIGQTYVIFGTANGFAANINVTDLNGTNGFIINGIDADDQSGYSVSSAGDVNGDGIDDMIIGARAADPNAELSGETYVVFGNGAGFGASLDLADLDGTNGFVIHGEDANDRSGRAVSSAGDINGDGIDDLLIGANRAELEGNSEGGTATDHGIAYVVFGDAAGFGASLEVADLDGTNGFAIIGASAGDFTGFSVSEAGDFNSDGIGDIIIGAPTDGAAGTAGSAYIVYGSDAGFGASLNLDQLDGINGFEIVGETGGDQFGFSVTGAGDVNGDGFDDILIGAPDADSNGNGESGRAYIIFGTDDILDPVIEAARMPDDAGIVINGVGAGDLAGFSVSNAGDVNGDGVDDILVGAPGAGQSYVILGRTNNIGQADNHETPAVQSIETADLVDDALGGEQIILFGNDGNDRLFGGVGALVEVNLAKDITTGEVAGDIHTYTDIEDVLGSAFDDTIVGNAFANSLYVLGGHDRLEGGDDNDSLFGGAGVDFFDRGTGPDTADYSIANTGVSAGLTIANVFASPGSLVTATLEDVFIGIENANSNDFADIIIETSFDDRLQDNGNDRIFGFEDGIDGIEMRDGPADFAALTITQVGLDTLIVSTNGTLTLKGFTATDLDASGFTFINPLPPVELPPSKQSVSEGLGEISGVSDEPFGDQDLIAAFLASAEAPKAPVYYTNAQGFMAILTEDMAILTEDMAILTEDDGPLELIEVFDII